MSGNSKVEIFEKLRMSKAWCFFKNYISSGREKNCIPTAICGK